MKKIITILIFGSIGGAILYARYFVNEMEKRKEKENREITRLLERKYVSIK